jgi:hypothetical protein
MLSYISSPTVIFVVVVFLRKKEIFMFIGSGSIFPGRKPC